MIVDGNIGTVTAPVTITTSSYLDTLSAVNVYAGIVIGGGILGTADPYGRRVGDVNDVDITGDFVGTFDAGYLNYLAGLDSGQSGYGFILGGDLEGTLEFAALGDQIWIQGDLLPGSEVLIKRDSKGGNGTVQTVFRQDIDDDNYGRIVIDGQLNGDIDIEGDLRGPIILNAIASGSTVRVGGSIISRDLTTPAALVEDGRIKIEGDIAGVLAIEGNVSGDSPVPNSNGRVQVDGDISGLLIVGGALAAGGDIKVEGELSGQIIIGDGALSDPWAQPVTLFNDTTPLVFDESSSQPYQAPFYNALPAALGGGAIGEAPFNFHMNESDPPVNQYAVLNAFGTRYEVTIEHYGPVYCPTVTTPVPLTVEFALPNCTGTSWTDVTDDFEFIVSSDSETIDRTVGVRPKTGESWAVGWYRMAPAEDELKCAIVNGNPDVVYDIASNRCTGFGIDDHYVVQVGNFGGGFLMAMDMNESGWIDTLDATEWMNDPQDFDGDQVADGADLLTLIYQIGQEVPD